MLAAGERLDPGVGLLLEANEVDDLARVARVRVVLGELLDSLAHGGVRVERGALEDDAHALEERPLALRGIVAEHRHVAGAPLAIALEDLDRRGLAGPVRAEQPEDLSSDQLEGDAAYGLVVAVALAQLAHLDGGVGHGSEIRRPHRPRRGPLWRRSGPHRAARSRASRAPTPPRAPAPPRSSCRSRRSPSGGRRASSPGETRRVPPHTRARGPGARPGPRSP